MERNLRAAILVDISFTKLSCHVLSYNQSSGEVTYETKDPAFCYTIVCKPENIVSLSTDLINWLRQVEKSKVNQYCCCLFLSKLWKMKLRGRDVGGGLPEGLLHKL